MPLSQYSLGIAVNLDSTLPASDHGRSPFAGFTAAVGKGPLPLTLHAPLGTLLLITAVAAVIGSARLAAGAPIALTVAALAMIVAWLSGSEFVAPRSPSACCSCEKPRPHRRPSPRSPSPTRGTVRHHPRQNRRNSSRRMIESTLVPLDG